jgi:hypothetical protein
MISIAFDLKGQKIRIGKFTTAGDYTLNGYMLYISEQSFNFLRSKAVQFIKGNHEHFGEYALLRLKSSEQEIMVFNSRNNNGHQWCSFKTFELLRGELGDRYIPYDPFDHDVFLIV